MPKRPYGNYGGPLKRRKALKAKRSQSAVAVPRGISTGTNIIRRSSVADLTYHKQVTLNGSVVVGGTGFTQFRMNGVYDPEVAIGGGQPRGFDQMALLYEEYTVTECMAEVYFNASNSAATGVIPFLAIRPESAGSPDAKAVFEGADRVILKKMIRAGSGGNGADSGYLKIAVDCRKYLGNKGIDQDGMRATVAGVPSDQIYLYAGCINATNGTATFDIDINVVLHYKVKFHGPKDPGAS